jgi:hypothetical protein
MRTLLQLYTGTMVAGLPLNFVTYNVLLVSCMLYALWKGGAPERMGAAILGLGTVLSRVFVSGRQTNYQSVETGILAIDILCLAAFVILALRAERFWPLWVAALMLLTVLAHVAKFVDPEMLLRAYAFLAIVWSYPAVLVMIVGTWRHQRRLSYFGDDRAWSPLRTSMK